MTAIDTVVLGLTLLAAALVASGIYAYRSRSQNPYWYWAWGVLLLAGAAIQASRSVPALDFVPPLLSPIYSAFLLAGAFFYAGRVVPGQILLAACALGLARAAAAILGATSINSALSLSFEPAAAVYAGWLVHRAARERDWSLPNQLMPIGFAAVAVVEVLDSLRVFSGADRDLMWPAWLAVSFFLAGLQLIASLERVERAEGQSAASLRDREETNERFLFLTSRMREVITEIGPDGRVVWVSNSVEEELGLPPREMIGKSARDLALTFDVQPASDPWIAGQRTSAPGDFESGVYSLRDGWGKRRWFETRLATHAERALTITRDVSDRVAAQKEIHTSEERFRKFSQLGSDYCYVVSGGAKGRSENWMTGAFEKTTGYAPEEMSEVAFFDLVHPGDIEEHRRRTATLLRDGGESSHEFRIIAKSGETRWIAENVLVEVSDEEFRVYGAARDVTEQRYLEQALAHRQKLDSLGLLAGGVAHDFNNLLMVILGHSEIAKEALAQGEDVTDDIDGIMEAADQASLLTQQLLAYAGRGAVDRRPLDLSERVRSVSELLSSAAGRVELELSLESTPPVIADSGELQQLTMNLVLNALEACNGEGRVRVHTRLASSEDRESANWILGDVSTDSDYVVLEVSDNGVGMTQRRLERIFDPFFTTKTTGRGLGLAAVSGIIRSLGGALRLTSRPEKGTTFTALLPVSTVEVATAHRTTGPGAAGGRILLIDDDKRVLEVTEKMLTSRGFQVEAASDGQTGVAAYREQPFDVVVLDAVMPGLSAAETFDEIRRFQPDARVLIASGHDMEHAVGDLLERGLGGFIAKPFRASELVERIEGLIADHTAASPRG